jgi:hypothetical protein
LIQSAPRAICSRTAARASSTDRTTVLASGLSGADGFAGVAPHTMPSVDTWYRGPSNRPWLIALRISTSP